jgi:hypothetical protein
MKIKLKLCGGCGLPKHIWKNLNGMKLCKGCAGKSITGVVRKPKPTAQRIPIRSSKRAKMELAYSILRKKYLDDHPMCHAHIDVRCTQKSEEIHHKAGRIEGLLNDSSLWLPTCRYCHMWIHKNEESAKELGFMVSRLTKIEEK